MCGGFAADHIFEMFCICFMVSFLSGLCFCSSHETQRSSVPCSGAIARATAAASSYACSSLFACAFVDQVPLVPSVSPGPIGGCTVAFCPMNAFCIKDSSRIGCDRCPRFSKRPVQFPKKIVSKESPANGSNNKFVLLIVVM